LAAIGILVFGATAPDPTMVTIGLIMLAVNALIVLNYVYFTRLAIEGGELVYRTNFGTRLDRVALGAIQRIDAKRYPGAHSGVSRSEEHTSELQSRFDLVCRLLL